MCSVSPIYEIRVEAGFPRDLAVVPWRTSAQIGQACSAICLHGAHAGLALWTAWTPIVSRHGGLA